jgi:hypothetical protein
MDYDCGGAEIPMGEKTSSLQGEPEAVRRKGLFRKGAHYPLRMREPVPPPGFNH